MATQPRKKDDPAGYIVDPELQNAIGVALLLGQPLLLTGEPGTGKTQLAHWLSHAQDLGEPLVFNTKSTSTARDLFYTFDAMTSFRHAHNREAGKTALDYITYNAFGLAILQSRRREDVQRFLPRDFAHVGPCRSVVLVDEIDKAPRDFPNDLLNEVVSMSFRLTDLENQEVAADPALRPILVLTSNSEKNLPDAFLRRCVFYNIPFPSRDRLIQIVKTRLGGFGDGKSAFLDSAVDFFMAVRDANVRKPSTAEMIDFTKALARNGRDLDVAVDAKEVSAAIPTLAKTLADTEEVRRVLKAKLGEH